MDESSSQHRGCYMDYACLGIPAASTSAAVQNAVERVMKAVAPGTALTLELFEEVESARDSVARFFKVPSQDLCFIENTTHGLGLLASAIDVRPHENIVVPDIEFISAALVWKQSQRRANFELRTAKTENGQVTLADIECVVDYNTRAIVVSAVQEVSGYRSDLAMLMDLAEANDAFLLVDGIQEAGAVSRNLSETRVHAYCAGGHKWLGSPFGLGFMYLNPTFYQQLEPSYHGYLGLREPETGWQSYLESRDRTLLDDLEQLSVARKFESGGAPNWLGAVGLKHAVKAVEARGIEAVEDHTLSLTQSLRQGLEELGLGEYMLGDSSRSHNAGIVTFSLPGGLDHERSLLRQLEGERIFVSLRSAAGVGGIRVSPYVENSLDDIHCLLESVKRYLRKA